MKMACFDRLKVYNTFQADGLVPLFYNESKQKTGLIAEALSKGGSRIIEFTNRGDMAFDVFKYLIKKATEINSELIVGVGSVVDTPTAALYINQGANFIVGPNFNPEIAKLCNRRRVAYIPGAATVNEITQALEYGVEIVKVFPASAIGGQKFVKALLGPMPWLKLMPTGGVSLEEKDIKNWFKSGACCIGMGSKLISKELIKTGDYKLLTEMTAGALKIIKNIRKN